MSFAFRLSFSPRASLNLRLFLSISLAASISEPWPARASCHFFTPSEGFDSGVSLSPALGRLIPLSKYTTFPLNRTYSAYPGIGVNYAGNHKKSLRTSLDASLKKLRTDYIDVLYVHWWDHSTSIPELMQSLADVVREGKVLYLGVSDTPGEWWLRTGVCDLASRKRRIGRIR